jgi:glutamyl-tRNA reductase
MSAALQVQTPAAPLAIGTAGEDIAVSVLDGIESDVRLTLRRRQVEAAKARVNAITGDFRRMIDDLKTDYSDAEAGIVRIYVQGVRPELVNSFLAINPNLTGEARGEVEAMANKLIDDALAEIVGAKPAEPKKTKK